MADLSEQVKKTCTLVTYVRENQLAKIEHSLANDVWVIQCGFFSRTISSGFSDMD